MKQRIFAVTINRLPFMLIMGVILIAMMLVLFTGTALADGGNTGGFPFPSWVTVAVPAIISIGLGIAALVVFIIAKAQGTWDADYPSRNRRGRRGRRR